MSHTTQTKPSLSLNYVNSLFLFAALSLGIMFSSQALALDPPTNIRLEGSELSWDPVAGANEYHIYYFDEPIPSSTVVGNFADLTGGTRWNLESRNLPFGYYTVVSIFIADGPEPVDFSNVTDGAIVPYFNSPQSTASSTVLIATGQVQSYYPDDDGSVQAGAKATSERFIVNGDGTFTDSLTQLVWIADSSCIPSVNWTAAVDYASGLTADGSSSCFSLQDGSAVGDWRLANIVELLSLYDYGSAGAIGNIPLTNVGAVIFDDFWSSTSVQSAATPNDIGLAWEVKYLSDPDAGSNMDQKSRLGRAWSVRDQ